MNFLLQGDPKRGKHEVRTWRPPVEVPLVFHWSTNVCSWDVPDLLYKSLNILGSLLLLLKLSLNCLLLWHNRDLNEISGDALPQTLIKLSMIVLSLCKPQRKRVKFRGQRGRYILCLCMGSLGHVSLLHIYVMSCRYCGRVKQFRTPRLFRLAFIYRDWLKSGSQMW